MDANAYHWIQMKMAKFGILCGCVYASRPFVSALKSAYKHDERGLLVCLPACVCLVKLSSIYYTGA